MSKKPATRKTVPARDTVYLNTIVESGRKAGGRIQKAVGE
jgi:hypothetical protein